MTQTLADRDVITYLPLYYFDELYAMTRKVYEYFYADPLAWEFNLDPNKKEDWVKLNSVDVDTWMYITYLLQICIPEEVRQCVENGKKSLTST